MGGGSLLMVQSEFWLRPNPFKGRGRQPLGESTRAHFHQLVSISTYQHIHILKQDLPYTRSVPGGGVILPEDVVRPEAIRINNERLCEWRQMSVGAHKIPISCANMSSKCIK
jgi:hypothetical protein